MDRYEASKKFAALGNPDTLKIVKMTLNHGPMDAVTLAERLEIHILEAKKRAQEAIEVGLLKEENGSYVCMEEEVDSLMAFVRTHCGHCCH